MADSSTDMITFHGWGFSRAVWKNWESSLPPGVSVSHADKGYFGESALPGFRQNAERKLILAHSFGLHWCPEELLKEADHLVILSGFLTFHPLESADNRRSRLVLRQMMSRFVEKPREVLSAFYRNTFKPEEPSVDIPDSFCHDSLLEDLEMLDASNLSPQLLHKIPGITIIHGESDEIVSNSRAREMYSLLSRRSQYFEVKHSGHGVPFTHFEQCCRFLLPVLKKEFTEISNSGNHHSRE